MCFGGVLIRRRATGRSSEKPASGSHRFQTLPLWVQSHSTRLVCWDCWGCEGKRRCLMRLSLPCYRPLPPGGAKFAPSSRFRDRATFLVDQSEALNCRLRGATGSYLAGHSPGRLLSLDSVILVPLSWVLARKSIWINFIFDRSFQTFEGT
jgi:hypothetical protein